MTKTAINKVGYIVLILGALIVPVIISDPYILGIFIMLYWNAAIAVSLRIVMTTGQLSLAHPAFVAVGAYTSALLVMRTGLSFWIALPIAGIISACLAVIVGYPSLRIKGIYFLLVTTALVEIVRYAIASWTDMTGGFSGLPNIPPPNPIPLPWIGALEFVSKVPFYYLILLIALVTVIVVHRIDRSRFGRIFNFIGSSDLLAESVGIGIMRYKLLAFTVGSFFAGITGSFYAHYFGLLHPDMFGLWAGISYLIFNQVGGMASVAGPICGAFLLTALPEILRVAKTYEPLIYGIILVIVIFLLPQGLISLPERIRSRFKRKKTDYAVT